MPRTEIAINTLPFWSRFVLSADLKYDGTNLERRIIQRGRRIPVFNYKQGDGAVPALEGAEATELDTILNKAAQTRGGGIFKIFGVSFTKHSKPYVAGSSDSGGAKLEHSLYPGMSEQPGNGAFGPICPSVEDERSIDALMCAAFHEAFRLQINIDGTKRVLEMGPCILYPGVGGAKNTIDTSNGDTFVSNYMPIREGIAWNPTGAVDSNLVVQLEAAFDIIVPTWTSPAGTANGEPPSESNPEIPDANRTAIGRKWSQGWIVNFHGREESPTSNVS